MESAHVKTPARLLDAGQVVERIGVSKSTLYRWVGEGMFPRPRRVGHARTKWLESEVEAWIASQPVIGAKATE